MINTERIKTQIWIHTSQSTIDKAKQIAEEKRMTFGGVVGTALERFVEDEEKNDERGS